VASLTLDDVPAKQLAQRWGVPQAGFFRRLGSTFDAIHDLGAQGAPHGTVVLAEEQTAGRGRGGRTWQSPVGGVWLGVLLRPLRAELGAASLRIGLVVADVADDLARRPAAQLKWPNDVLCDDRKLAGILCEGRWQGDALQWLAVGVGINVANDIPPAVRATAVSLAEIVPGVRRIDVLDRLVPALPQVMTHSGVLTESESAAFAARDWLRGRLLRAPVYGRACGVRADGALLVEAQGGTIGVREGHVELA
jgi:BirA family biotin operon repressor/biotin-[acetyl-CoA-carboxylase] ligase